MDRREEHRLILEHIALYLEASPEQRFGQVLYNLHINEFINVDDPEKGNYALRDIYNDSDNDILRRILDSY